MSRTDQSIFFANRGVERNKRPLSNIVVHFEVREVPPEKQTDLSERLREKLFKGQLIEMWWNYEKARAKSGKMKGRFWSMFGEGIVHPDKVKKVIGIKQWGKFCQGKREFILQRRMDGKNVKK